MGPKDMTKHFTQKIHRRQIMTSTSLATREMYLKTTMRYPYPTIKMAKIKSSDNTKCWRGCRETGSLIHCWWEHKLVQPLWEDLAVSLKAKHTTTYDQAITLSGIYPRERETHGHTILYMNARNSFLVITQNRE